jgi:uncharacterized RDD family membrane protein YckC
MTTPQSPMPQSPMPQHTTPQPQHQDPYPDLVSHCAVVPPLFVPPPQFGRPPHTTPSREPARSQIRPADTTSRPRQPEPSLAPPDVGALGDAHVPGPLADFGARAISFLIDCVAPVIVLNLLLSLGAVTGSMAWRSAPAVVAYLVLLVFGIWNSGYLQGTTGQSLGRRVARTKLVTIETGQPVGFGRAVVRQICHGLEFGIGDLWPLWDGQRQTFADKIVGAVVLRVGSPVG